MSQVLSDLFLEHRNKMLYSKHLEKSNRNCKKVCKHLKKSERKLLLEYIDEKDLFSEEIGFESFMYGVKIGFELGQEINKNWK